MYKIKICIILLLLILMMVLSGCKNEEYDKYEQIALENMGKPIDVECCIMSACTIYSIGSHCGNKCISYCERGVLTPRESCGNYGMVNPAILVWDGCLINQTLKNNIIIKVI